MSLQAAGTAWPTNSFRDRNTPNKLWCPNLSRTLDAQSCRCFWSAGSEYPSGDDTLTHRWTDGRFKQQQFLGTAHGRVMAQGASPKLQMSGETRLIAPQSSARGKDSVDNGRRNRPKNGMAFCRASWYPLIVLTA